MSIQRTVPAASTRARSGRRATSARGTTMPLEAQSVAVFGVAVLIGVGALAVEMPVVVTVALLGFGFVLVARALSVVAADPAAARPVRPREMATWDSTLALAMGVFAMLLVLTEATGGALVATGGAVTLALLQLRTRYALA